MEKNVFCCPPASSDPFNKALALFSGSEDLAVTANKTSMCTAGENIDVSSCHCRKPRLVVTCGGFSQVIKLPECRQCLEHWECGYTTQHSTGDPVENHSLCCGQKRLRETHFPSVSCCAHKAGEPGSLLSGEGVVLLEVWQREVANLPIPWDVNNWWHVCNAHVNDFTV